MGVTGARVSVLAASETLEAVWVPRFTPSRVPLLTQRWTVVPETPAQRPLIRINASVHLLDWTDARYYVKACNPGGCSRSPSGAS